MKCLQDQVRCLLQHITKENPLPQDNEEMNKKDFDHLNQNDTNRIITNSCPEISDASKAETEDYVTYQHFTSEHYKEINNQMDQKKEIQEVTIISVSIVGSHQQLVVDQTPIQIPNLCHKNQRHIDTSLMSKELDRLYESNKDLCSRVAATAELQIKVQSESHNYNHDDKDQLGIIKALHENGILNQPTDGEYSTSMEEHRESLTSNQISLSSLNVLVTISENQGTT